MLESIALGEMGLELGYFYSLTWREFNNTLQGFRRMERQRIREGWEQTRALYCAVIRPYMGKAADTRPQSIYPLPWDNEKGEKYQQIDPLKKTRDVEQRFKEVDLKTQKRE